MGKEEESRMEDRQEYQQQTNTKNASFRIAHVENVEPVVLVHKNRRYTGMWIKLQLMRGGQRARVGKRSL
jgi:hypothetical protein